MSRANPYPAAFRTMLMTGETSGQAAARQAANPYRQAGMAASFDAGWMAWRHRERLGDMRAPDHLGKNHRAAWRRGLAARGAFEQSLPREDHAGS